MSAMPDYFPKPVDELASIDRYTYLEHYRFKKPFVLRGGAKQIPAFDRWSLEYLESKIGGVTIQPLIYGDEKKRDYSRAQFLEMTFAEFRAELESGNSRTLYWFEGPVSANFWGGTGKHARVNEALHTLTGDFAVPEFLRLDEIIYAQIILGCGRNGTVLHHDYGGEAKCLMQLMGEKHVLLVPPQYGKYVALHSITSQKNFTVSTLDLRGSDFESICRQVPVYEATIRPGDVLYWPSFWLHDIANSGAVNLAINAPVDEMPVNPLMLRHLFATNLARLKNAEDSIAEDVQSIERVEEELLDYTGVSTLWELHSESNQYRDKHWRSKK
jgi:hypothetical protein